MQKKINIRNYFYSIREFFHTPYFFVGAILCVTLAFAWVAASLVIFEKGNMPLPLLWLLGFCFLMLNVSYVFLCSIYYLMGKPSQLNEVQLKNMPPVAIVYTIRNESFGLFERMCYTLSNNNLPPVRLCVLSDSDRKYLEYESEVVTRLREIFGDSKIYYWHRMVPVERKQGNIRGWLVHHHSEYKYFLVCDADTLVPAGVLLKLLKKAEHNDNADIAVFQSRLHVAHVNTIFSKFLAVSSKFSQELYTTVNQRIFKRATSYGSAALIRCEEFLKIILPKDVLSHDIWETVFLDREGYRCVFCYDVVCYEEAPSNYIEMRKRDRRWLRGNMQTYYLPFIRGISFGSRFYVLYGLYMYISQPVFLIWMILSLAGTSFCLGRYIFFKSFIETPSYSLNLNMTTLAAMVLCILFLHKFVVVKRVNDFKDIIKEITFSTMICLNNVFYVSYDIFSLILNKKIEWVPMNKNPFAILKFRDALKMLWPTTILGILALFLGLAQSPYWALWASPFLFSFIFGIPVVYATSFSKIGGVFYDR